MGSLINLLAKVLWGIDLHEDEQTERNLISGNDKSGLEDLDLTLTDELPDEDALPEPEAGEPEAAASESREERQAQAADLLRQLERRHRL